MGFMLPFGTIVGGTEPAIAGFLYDAKGSYELPFAVIILGLIGSIVCLVLATPPIHARERET